MIPIPHLQRADMSVSQSNLALTFVVQVPSPVRAVFADVVARIDAKGFVLMDRSEYHLSLHHMRVPDVGDLPVVSKILDDLAELWPLPTCRLVGLERWGVKRDLRSTRLLVARHTFGRAWVNFILELRKRLKMAGYNCRRRHVVPHVTLLRSRDHQGIDLPSWIELPRIEWAPESISIIASDPGPPRQSIVHHKTLLGGGAGAMVSFGNA